MCPPGNRTVTDNVTIHVDVFGRAHRPSPTVISFTHEKNKNPCSSAEVSAQFAFHDTFLNPLSTQSAFS